MELCVCLKKKPYQLQQAEYQSRAPPDYVIGFAAELHKAMQTLRLLPPACDEVLHLRCENERWPVPVIESEKVIAPSRSELHMTTTAEVSYCRLTF